MKVLVAQLYLTLQPIDCIACQDPLSMEFSRREYWSGKSFPSPGAPLDPGIESGSPPWQADFFFFFLTTEPLGKPLNFILGF